MRNNDCFTTERLNALYTTQYTLLELIIVENDMIDESDAENVKAHLDKQKWLLDTLANIMHITRYVDEVIQIK